MSEVYSILMHILNGYISYLMSRVIIFNTYNCMKDHNTQKPQNDGADIPIREDSSALLKILSKNLKDKTTENIQLMKKYNDKTIAACRQTNLRMEEPNTEQLLSKLLQSRTKKKDNLESQMQKIKNQMKVNWEKIILKEKDDQISKLNSIIDQLKKEKIIDRTTIADLNKEILKINQSSVDVNQFNILTNTMNQYSSIMSQQSTKYIESQEKNIRQMSQLKRNYQQSLADFTRINADWKRENQQFKKESEKPKGVQKEAVLAAGIAALKVFNHVNVLEKQLQTNKQYQTAYKELLKSVKDLQEGEAIVNLNFNNLLENKFKKIMEISAQQISNLRQKTVIQESDISTKTRSFTAQKKELQEKLSTLRGQYDAKERQLNKQKQDYQNYKKSNELKINKLQNDLNTQKDISSKQNQKIAESQSRLTDLTLLKKQSATEIQKLNKQIQIFKNKVNTQQNQITAKQKTITQLTKTGKEKDTTITTQQQKINQLQAQKKILNAKVIELQTKVKKIQAKVEELQTNVKDLSTKKKDLQAFILQLRNNIVKLQGENKDQVVVINQLKVKLQKMTNQLKICQKERAKLSTESQDLKFGLQSCQEKVRQLTCYESAFKLVNDKLITELSYFVTKQKYFIDIQYPQETIKEVLQNFKSIFSQAKYFGDSEIIEREKINFLAQEIKSFTNSVLAETKLIYRYDPRNSVNFHQFIDGVENLFVVIKLINGYVVGGYSCFPIEKDKQKSKSIGYGKGIIFSLTHNRSFVMKRDPRTAVLTYDDFFFIFGNSELRLKSQEKKFFSNFGVANSTFENGTFPRTEFLGVSDMSNNELELICFEFYQLKFKL